MRQNAIVRTVLFKNSEGLTKKIQGAVWTLENDKVGELSRSLAEMYLIGFVRAGIDGQFPMLKK